MVDWIGKISGIAMPFFNIPLILRIWQRRSSTDISLVWAVGAWVCTIGLLPSSLKSPIGSVLWLFGIVNAIFFTGVFVSVVWFHPNAPHNRGKISGQTGPGN